MIVVGLLHMDTQVVDGVAIDALVVGVGVGILSYGLVRERSQG